jgi:hypothetical protein
MADCRRFPSDSNCSLTIIGDEEEVIRAATEHAASVHGHAKSAELSEQIRGMLEPEAEYKAGARAQEQMPG